MTRDKIFVDGFPLLVFCFLPSCWEVHIKIEVLVAVSRNGRREMEHRGMEGGTKAVRDGGVEGRGREVQRGVLTSLPSLSTTGISVILATSLRVTLVLQG
jgi:hypothetical protein